MRYKNPDTKRCQRNLQENIKNSSIPKVPSLCYNSIQVELCSIKKPTKSFLLHHSTEASNEILTPCWHQGTRLKSEAQFPTNTDIILLLTYSSNLWKALSCYRRNTCKEPYSLTGLATCTLFQTCTETVTRKKVQIFLVLCKMFNPIFTSRWTNPVSTN